MTDRATDDEKKRLEYTLRERIKELSCLYEIAKLIERHGDSIDDILQGVVELIPVSWQYPEITSARIIFEGREFRSPDFSESEWIQTADIAIKSIIIGRIEVYYLIKKPDLDEGPFLREERALINAISERLGKACERIRTSRQLRKDQQALENKNIALHELISRVQEDKQEFGRQVATKIDRLIMPLVHEIENHLDDDKRTYITLLKEALNELSMPYNDTYAKAVASLSPNEIQICTMIKNGLRSKEIARLRNISPATVARHRERIRRKLKIANREINLASYLQSIMSRQPQS